MEVGSGRDMYGMTAITRITPKMVAGTHGEGPASAAASLDGDIAIITLESWAHHLKLQSMTNEDTRPKTTEFQREDHEWWETNKLVHKLEVSWRIPKESKQSKVRQDRYCSTQKQKKRKRKLHQYSCNPTRIHDNFQLHRKALVRLLQISLSPHNADKEALQFPHTRHSLFSLPLSCPLWWQVWTRVGRVLGIAPPNPKPRNRVSTLGTKFDNHSHPQKIEYPDWYIPAVNQTTKFRVITHHHGYQRLKYPVIAHSFGILNLFLNFFVFSNKNQTCLVLEKHYVVFFLFLNSNSWTWWPLVVFVLFVFYFFNFL